VFWGDSLRGLSLLEKKRELFLIVGLFIKIGVLLCSNQVEFEEILSWSQTQEKKVFRHTHI